MHPRTWRLRRPRLGTVLGGLALFVALQGTAFALPGLNSVDSGDIVNGQVRGPDLGPLLRANGAPTNVPVGLSVTAVASCPPGTRIISVGYSRSAPPLSIGNIDIVANAARVTATNPPGSGGTIQLTARAFCLAA